MKNSISIILFLGILFMACGGGSKKETVDALPPQVAKAKVSEGQRLYKQYCTACHQNDGSGVPNMYPPLAGTDWVTGDKTRLIDVVLNGMNGEIEVNGKQYNGVMTPHNFLTDEQLADVLTYIRQSFGNDASEITAKEVAKVRADS